MSKYDKYAYFKINAQNDGKIIQSNTSLKFCKTYETMHCRHMT